MQGITHSCHNFALDVQRLNLTVLVADVPRLGVSQALESRFDLTTEERDVTMSQGLFVEHVSGYDLTSSKDLSACRPADCRMTSMKVYAVLQDTGRHYPQRWWCEASSDLHRLTAFNITQFASYWRCYPTLLRKHGTSLHPTFPNIVWLSSVGYCS